MEIPNLAPKAQQEGSQTWNVWNQSTW